MKTDISNVLSNGSLTSVGSNPVDAAYAKAEAHVKKEKVIMPEALRWAERMKEIDEKRKIKINNLAAVSADKKVGELIKATINAEKPQSVKKTKKEEEVKKPIVVEAGASFSYKELINSNIEGTIDAEEFIRLIMDFRSLVAGEKSYEIESVAVNPVMELRVEKFCNKLNFKREEFNSLTRIDRQHLALHAYVGFRQNVAFGLQLSTAMDLAAAQVGARNNIDYVSRMKLINESFNAKRVAPAGSNTESGHKQILNFAARAKNAALETFQIMEAVNKPGYIRDLALFKKAAVAIVQWVSCETVLKLFEEEIRANGYTDFASKDADTFLMISRLAGFNVAQAQAIVVAALNEPLYSEELIDAFVAKLVKLDKVTIKNEGSAAFAKIGDLHKKFNKIKLVGASNK